MSDQPAPCRAYYAEITVNADTLADLIDQLTDITCQLEDDGVVGSVISGGVSSSVQLAIIHDPNMTHDKYMAANKAWLAARRAKENTGA